METEKIYYIDRKSKKYLKLKKSIKTMITNSIILSIIFLISMYIIDEILDLSVFFPICIYLALILFLIMISIINYLKFIKKGNSYVIKLKDEILFFYADTSKQMSSSVNDGMRLGGIISQSHSNVVRTVGVGISAVSSLKNNNNDATKIENSEEIPPNMTVDNIINDPKTFYDLYKNVRFIKKTKKYLYFRGDKFNINNIKKNSSFKIERALYKNIDDILK